MSKAKAMFIFIAVLSVGLVVFVHFNGCADHKKAIQAAKEYAQNVPHATGKISCMNKDSDNDGYCSCTIFRAKGDPLAVECACGSLSFKEGCRIPKLNLGTKSR